MPAPSDLVRLLAEAETIARIRHPNIVQIYGLGDHDGRLYFEMEYIEGGNLADRLNGTPWAPRPGGRRLVAVLARAVEHAIGRGSSTATSSRPTSC